MRSQLALALLLTTPLLWGCRSPFYADRGAAVGGVTGAGVGAAIAEVADGEPLAGAAIGSLLGAVTGGAIGSEMDARHSMTMARVPAPPLQEVVNMTSAGLSDDVIIAQVNTHGPTRPLSSSELIGLKQQGVSDAVIRAMQRGSAVPSVIQQPCVVAPPPVIVSPPVVPVHRLGIPIHGRPPIRRARHHGPRWGVSFGGSL